MIPATGVFAPERKLVAVRAIAPVTGMPPTNGVTRFATPCATSSTFELWRSPDIESATTAESRLSMAASSATVNAEGSRGRIRSGAELRDMQIAETPEECRRTSSRSSRRAARKPRSRAVAVSSATIEPGTLGTTAAQAG